MKQGESKQGRKILWDSLPVKPLKEKIQDRMREEGSLFSQGLLFMAPDLGFEGLQTAGVTGLTLELNLCLGM